MQLSPSKPKEQIVISEIASIKITLQQNWLNSRPFLLNRNDLLKQLDVIDGEVPLIKLRNPYGMVEWKGAFSDNDRQAWSRLPK